MTIEPVRLLRRLAILGAFAPAVLTGQDTTTARDSLARNVERLQRTVDSLRAASERQTEQLIALDERSTAHPVAGAAADSSRRALASGLGIRGKPFVRGSVRGTSIGGYMSMAYINDIQNHTSTFDQVRLVPFIYAEITDRLHFGTEIEFEHAPVIEVEDGEASGGGEISVEFATLDYRIAEALNVRGGVILAPLGRFNLLHDDPINQLTDRPLFDRFIVHSALSQTGFGFYGTTYPTERSLLSYELYLVNGYTKEIIGPNGLDLTGGSGRSESDNNFAKSVVGRIAFSPLLGLELGASAETGKYATRDGTFRGNERLTTWVLDGSWRRGPVALLGEYGAAKADIPDVLSALDGRDAQAGYYAEAQYYFGHGLLPPRATSAFTGVVRWDNVDLARGVDGLDQQRLTVGLNWRPVPDAALKTGFQWNWQTAAESARLGPVEHRLLLSMATYF